MQFARTISAVCFILACTSRVYSAEDVARLSVTELNTFNAGRSELQGFIVHNSQEFRRGRPTVLSPQEKAARTFVVYTKPEVDELIAAKQKTIDELLQQILILQKNIKDLAQAHDSQSKRIDDLEKSKSN